MLRRDCSIRRLQALTTLRESTQSSEQSIGSSARSGKDYSGYSYNGTSMRVPSVSVTTLNGIVDTQKLLPRSLGL